MFRDRFKALPVILCTCILICSIPSNVRAEESISASDGLLDPSKTNSDLIPNQIAAEIGENARTINDVLSQIRFSQKGNGHSFAAEQGNNFIDRIKGKNTIVVGDDNVTNGPDRKIINRDGSVTLIQDKYYSNPTDNIDACFDENGFKYISPDGECMAIEVPKDQYDKCVSKMETKIREGKVKGVTDPHDAKKLVRKGNLTYKQAENLAKAGTVESLTYDAAHGIITGVGAFGIGTLLNYAVLRISGKDKEKALKESAVAGVKTGAGVFCTTVIASQLTKAGAFNLFKPSTEALTKKLGEDFSKALLKAYGQKAVAGGGRSAMTASKQAAYLIRSELLVATVTTVVFSVPDAIDMFRGRISKKQFIKNFAVTATSVMMGTVGYGVGGAIGNLIVPGVGVIPGQIVGALLIGTGGAVAADKIADFITDDDAEEMYEIIEKQFVQYCDDYLLNEDEASHVLDAFANKLDEDMYKDMYQSKDRVQYISGVLEPLFEAEVAKREVIEPPTEEELRLALKEELKGIVFIH